MNAAAPLSKFRIALRLANGKVLLNHVVATDHEDVRARVHAAMGQYGLPPCPLLVCISGEAV